MLNSSISSRWLVCYQPNSQAHIRLFCFPYAGASPAFFRDWHKQLLDSIELFVVHLPGRGSRIKEPAFTQMQALTEVIVKEIVPYINQPFVFFGHSLGALIAFEVACELRRQFNLTPIHLFVAACPAPHLSPSGSPSYQLPEPEFIERMKIGNGTPDEILKNPKLMAKFLPLMRADAELGDTYTYREQDPLNSAISVFGGREDFLVSEKELVAWYKYTQNYFRIQMFPGNHFFINNNLEQLLKVLSDELKLDLALSSSCLISKEF